MYLALGTSAQQLDASFNTTAALEIFEVDFSDPSLEMQLRGALPTTNRWFIEYSIYISMYIFQFCSNELFLIQAQVYLQLDFF